MPVETGGHFLCPLLVLHRIERVRHAEHHVTRQVVVAGVDNLVGTDAAAHVFLHTQQVVGTDSESQALVFQYAV